MSEKNKEMQAEELEKVAGGNEVVGENNDVELGIRVKGEQEVGIRVKGSEKVDIPRGGRVQVRV